MAWGGGGGRYKSGRRVWDQTEKLLAKGELIKWRTSHQLKLDVRRCTSSCEDPGRGGGGCPFFPAMLSGRLERSLPCNNVQPKSLTICLEG